MFGYKDMTFCSFYKNCKDAENCHRPLTDKVKKDAEKWMKNALICQFAEKPSCHKLKQ